MPSHSQPHSPEREKVQYHRVPDRDDMAHRDSESGSDHSDFEDWQHDEYAPLARIKHYARRARRRRPLLATAFGSVLCFSVFVWVSFSTYIRFLPVATTPLPIPPESTEGVVIPYDPSHILVPVQPLRPPPQLLTTPVRPPLELLVDIYVNGVAANTDPTTHTQPPIDIVYLYVNASSPYFEDAKNAKADEEGMGWAKDRAKHYRDNGELRGAVRSGEMSLGERARKIHLLSGAFDFDQEQHADLIANITTFPGVTQWRMGQIPNWLDWDNRGKLHYHTHSDLYRLPRDNDGSLHHSLNTTEEYWRSQALPTFNSFAIESRIGWMEGLSPNFIFSNDDMFMRHNHSLSDYHHPILGNVVRIAPEFMVEPEVKSALKSTGGEWGGLGNAAALISDRFPKRKREYVLHLPKALSRHIAHEASVMFAEELSSAATRTFRESRRGRADVEFAWLLTHLGMERWREGLLWSFVVARVGGVEGVWGDAARQEMRELFGEERGKVTVYKKKRKTVEDMDNTAFNAGWDEPFQTNYIHCELLALVNALLTPASFDGHFPGSKKVLEGKLAQKCTFNVAECLPLDFLNSTLTYSATEIFTHMTFDYPACGDCLIDALMNKSPRGLAQFLPSPNATFTPPERQPQQWDRDEPMLPLTPTWEEADFSLSANVRQGQDDTSNTSVNLLKWTVKLLSRYAYVYAKTEARFYLVHNPGAMKKNMKDMEKNPGVALLCLNDDQPDTATSEVKDMFREWMSSEFDERPSWEKDLPW